MRNLIESATMGKEARSNLVRLAKEASAASLTGHRPPNLRENLHDQARVARRKCRYLTDSQCVMAYLEADHGCRFVKVL
jgi:hypothetical protein